MCIRIVLHTYFEFEAVSGTVVVVLWLFIVVELWLFTGLRLWVVLSSPFVVVISLSELVLLLLVLVLVLWLFVLMLVVLLRTFFLGLVRSPSRVRLCAVKYSMSERARRLEGTVREESKMISVVTTCTNVGGVVVNFLLGLPRVCACALYLIV
jgi:hypothetical protein